MNDTNKSRNILYISVFLLFVLSLWAGFNAMPRPETVNINNMDANPIDLSLYDFQNTVYYSDGLSKNYESYPKKLYTPVDFTSDRVTEAPQKMDIDGYRTYQYMTHRLQIKLPQGQSYGISMKSSDYSMRLYIDGKDMGCVGLPGVSKETSIPRTADRTYYFIPVDEAVELIIQTSNFVHNEGCQPPAFHLGTQQNIIKTERSHLFISFIIIGCLFMAFLYHLALFLLNRHRKTSLIFSFCCLLLMLMSNKLIPMFFENYNWYWAFRFEYIVHFLTFSALTVLLRMMYPTLLHKISAYSYYILSGLYILSTFILDSSVYSGLLIYFDAVSVLMILYILVRLAMEVKGGKLQNLLSFIGIFVLCAFGVNDILYHNNIYLFGSFAGQVFTAPIGMVFFVLCYAMVLSLDIAETERKVFDVERQIEDIQEKYNSLLAEQPRESDTSVPIDLAVFGLSQREIDVAWLLIDGKARKEIAALLDISMGTVNTYCTRIFQKTNSSGLNELYKNLGIIKTKPN